MLPSLCSLLMFFVWYEFYCIVIMYLTSSQHRFCVQASNDKDPMCNTFWVYCSNLKVRRAVASSECTQVHELTYSPLKLPSTSNIKHTSDSLPMWNNFHLTDSGASRLEASQSGQKKNHFTHSLDMEDKSFFHIAHTRSCMQSPPHTLLSCTEITIVHFTWGDLHIPAFAILIALCE